MFFRVAIEDVDTARHPDSNDQRKGHDVGRIERDVEPTHEADHPYCPDADRQQRQDHAHQRAKMDEDQDRDGRQRIPGGLDITVLEQRRVFIELHGRPGGVGSHGAQLTDKSLLLVPLPDILLGIDLQQVKLAGFAHEAVP